jgi:hypothetical protein
VLQVASMLMAVDESSDDVVEGFARGYVTKQLH